MGKQRFLIDIRGTAILELDDAVIAAVDDDWRKQMYPDIFSPEQIAEHLAYNLVINGATLSHLDGWADQPDANARVWNESFDIEATLDR